VTPPTTTSPSDPPPPAAVPVAIPLVNPTPPAVAPAPAGNTVDVTLVPADAPPAETPADALLAAHDALPPLGGATPSAGPVAEASAATGVTPPVMTSTPAAALPFSTDAVAPTTPLGRSAGWGPAADPSGIPAPSTRELLFKGAAGGLLPFAPPNATTAGRELLLTAAGAAVTAVAATSALRTAALGTAERRSVVHRGGGVPKPPSGPPSDAGAGAVAGGPGGVVSGVWCALLIGCVLRLAVALRRHRICLSLPAPSGVVLLLHRPG
jgi:hypothetical protein